MINFTDTTTIKWSIDASGNLTANATSVVPGGFKQTAAPVSNVVTFDVSLGSSLWINVTDVISNIVLNSPVDGQEITIVFAQDSTGHAVTLATNMLGSPTITTTANKHSAYKWTYNTADTNWYLIPGSNM